MPRATTSLQLFTRSMIFWTSPSSASFSLSLSSISSRISLQGSMPPSSRSTRYSPSLTVSRFKWSLSTERSCSSASSVRVCSSLRMCSLAAPVSLTLKPQTTLGTPIRSRSCANTWRTAFARASWRPGMIPVQRLLHGNHRRVHGPDHVLQEFHEPGLGGIAVNKHLLRGHLAQQAEQLAAVRLLRNASISQAGCRPWPP